MAGLGDLLQRIARSLEEANAQRPADDLRTRLGYGTGDDEEEPASDFEWEPEEESESGYAGTPETTWKPAALRRPETPRAPAQATAESRAAATRGMPRREPVVGSAPRYRSTTPHPPTTPASALSERIRTRLSTPDALREAFVVKEILDRPLGYRRRR